MRFCRQTKPAVWLVVLLCLVSLPVRSIRAQAETTLRMEPATASLAPGTGVRIDLVINEASDVYGFQVRIQFDPSVVQVVDQDPDRPGIQVTAGDFFDLNEGFLIANQADNGRGEITYAFTLLAPATPVEGTGVILSFEMQAAAAGQSQVNLESAILSSADGLSLPFSAQEGQVIVVGEGEETPTELPPSSTPAGTPPGGEPTATSPPVTPTKTPTEGVPTSTPASVTPTETPGEARPTSGDTATNPPPATAAAEYTGTAAPASPSPTSLSTREPTSTVMALGTGQTSPPPTRTSLAVPTARATASPEEEQPGAGFGAGWLWAVSLLFLLIAGLVIGYFLRTRGEKDAD
jgi:hypothetical protein